MYKRQGVTGAHDLRGLVLHKVLGRIVAAVGSAGANPHDALDAALVCLVSQNLGDDVLNLFLSSHRASADVYKRQLVVVIALGLLKDLESKSDGIAGLLALGSVVGVEAVDDDVVGVDGQSGACLLYTSGCIVLSL